MAVARTARVGAYGRSTRVISVALLGFVVLGVSSVAHPQWASWDQPAHIREVSAELANRVRAKGADQVSAEIERCYRDQEKASTLVKPLEKCVIQDVIHSWVTAGVYGRLSKENLAKVNLPSPDAVVQAMSKRVTDVFRRHKIPEDKAREFIQVVRQQGMSAYGQALQTR
jgi:hypothetical protein